MAELTKRYSKILLQKNQTDMVSQPFYVGDYKVAVTAFSGGTGLPPGGKVTFQQVLYIDGGRSDGSLCTPATFNASCEFDYKPYVSCGCEPKLSERMSYIEFNQPGWYRAVYSGPSRPSVLVSVQETGQKADTCGCAVVCCPVDVDLTVDKAVSAEVITAGKTGTFTLVLRNNGPEASTGGSIVDELPAGLTYGIPVANYTGGAVGTQPALAQLGSGDWHYTLLPVGGVITITIPFTADAPGLVEIPDRNMVKIIPGMGERDLEPLNNSDEVHFIVIKPRAALSVVKTILDDSLKAGDTYQYQITATNAGPDAAPGAILTDSVPSGLDVTSIGMVYSGGASGAATLTRAQLASGYAIPALPAGGTVTAVINGVVPGTGIFTNVATIKAPVGVQDPDVSDNSSAVVLTSSVREADVSVAKTADAPSYQIGDTVTYVVTVLNAGPDDANNTTLKDILPTGLINEVITRVASGGAASPVPTRAQLAVGWVIPTLPAGGSITLTIKAETTAPGVFTNMAQVTPPANRNDTNPGNNSALAVIAVDPPGYTICGGDKLEPTHNIFVEGSLMKCVNGVVEPLECGDIIKVLPNGCEPGCATAVRASNPTLIVGAGVCVDVQATGFANGIAVLRGRDLSSELGSVAQGGSTGAHLQYTHTNNSSCPQLLEARLVANGNIARWAPVGTRLSFVYNLGTALNIDMPTTASNPLQPNFATMRQTIFAAASNTRGGTPGINEYQESTVSGARHIEVLQPGQSITLYAQWWAVLYEDTQLPALTPIHGHMGIDVKVYENGAYL